MYYLPGTMCTNNQACGILIPIRYCCGAGYVVVLDTCTGHKDYQNIQCTS